MSFSKREFNTIQKAVRNLRSEVPLTKFWQDIYNERGIGKILSKKLLLNSDDYNRLRELVVREVGLDPLTDGAITGDRLAVAAVSRDEKMATETVFSGMIRVNRLSGDVPLLQGNAVTPAGTLSFVTAKDILVDNLTTVLIVENGMVARYWHKCVIPEQLKQALVVYRGHGVETKTVLEWLSNLPDGIRKIGYFDFDPAGLGIAVDYNMDAILIPDPVNNDLVVGINNKPETHIKQLLKRPYLHEHLPKSCHWVFNWMTSEGRRCAVTQERLMVLGWQMRILELTND